MSAFRFGAKIGDVLVSLKSFHLHNIEWSRGEAAAIFLQEYSCLWPPWFINFPNPKAEYPPQLGLFCHPESFCRHDRPEQPICRPWRCIDVLNNLCTRCVFNFAW